MLLNSCDPTEVNLCFPTPSFPSLGFFFMASSMQTAEEVEKQGH